MEYYLDGYNILFSESILTDSLENQRHSLIIFFQKQFKIHALKGVVVFDGSHQRDEETGISYKSPLEIVYAPKGQSADSYIVEKISLSRAPHQITVVTNDRGLAVHARSKGAKVQSIHSFFSYLKKQRTKKICKQKREMKDTPQNIKRLTEIFEERLKNEPLD